MMISERVVSMKPKVRWGVLSCANIAIKKVIPAMQRGDWSEVGADCLKRFTKGTAKG